MTPHESPGESRNVEQGYRKSTPASKLHPGNPHSETESETSATVKSINGRGYRRRSAQSPKPFQVVVDDLLQGRWGRKIHDGWWGGDEDTSRGKIDVGSEAVEEMVGGRRAKDGVHLRIIANRCESSCRQRSENLRQVLANANCQSRFVREKEKAPNDVERPLMISRDGRLTAHTN